MIVLLWIFIGALSVGMFWLWPTMWIAGASLSAVCVFVLLCNRLRKQEESSTFKERIVNMIYVPAISLVIGAIWIGIPFLILPDRNAERRFARRKDSDAKAHRDA